MSLLFWRKPNPLNNNNVEPVETSTTNPFPVQIVQNDETEQDVVPVEVKGAYLPLVPGNTVTRKVEVPGVGAAAIYASGDAFGTLIKFSDVFRAGKNSGTIVKAIFYDLDDEGVAIDMPLYSQPITITADNSANAATDQDSLSCVGVVQIGTFFDLGGQQIGQADNLPMWVQSTGVDLWTQLIVRGSPTIAAGSVPSVSLTVVPD
jgi:hypothetical protein